MIESRNSPLAGDVPTRDILLLLAGGLLLELAQFMIFPSFLHFQILLVIVLYVGWHSGPARAALWGTVFGLTEDYLLGLYLGLNGLSKTLLAFAASYLSRHLTAESHLLRIAIVVTFSIIDQLLVFAVLLLLGERFHPPSYFAMIGTALGTGLISTVFTRTYDKIRFPPTDFRRL